MKEIAKMANRPLPLIIAKRFSRGAICSYRELLQSDLCVAEFFISEFFGFWSEIKLVKIQLCSRGIFGVIYKGK